MTEGQAEHGGFCKSVIKCGGQRGVPRRTTSGTVVTTNVGSLGTLSRVARLTDEAWKVQRRGKTISLKSSVRCQGSDARFGGRH